MKSLSTVGVILILCNIGKESTAYTRYPKCSKQPRVRKLYDSIPNAMINVGNDYIATAIGNRITRSTYGTASQRGVVYPVRTLYSDRFDNTLIFIGDDKMYNFTRDASVYINIYRMPVSVLAKTSGTFKGDTFGSDSSNTIYAVSTKGIVYKSANDKNFQTLSRLSRYGNVSFIAQSKDDVLYFVYSHSKTSWVINGNTGNPMIQSSVIRGIHFYENPADVKTKSLYYLDRDCAVKKVSLQNFKVGKAKKTHVMNLEGCGETQKFMFSKKERVYVSHRNKVLDLSNGLEKICVIAEVPDGVTIKYGVISFNNHILLVTNDGVHQVLFF